MQKGTVPFWLLESDLCRSMGNVWWENCVVIKVFSPLNWNNLHICLLALPLVSNAII